MVQQNQMKKSKNDDVFMLVKQDKKVIITVGEFKAHEREFDTFEQAEQFIASKPYKLIFNTFQILTHYAEKNKTAEKVTADTKNN